ncbi:MAG: hypothetical protein Q9191_007631, partial [Dirinaria sp. TL-2023a]
MEAFESGESVTAKITWLPQGRSEDGASDYSRPGSRGGRGAADGGRTRYISCTPLLGSDDQVGVWMVIMVENEQVTGTLPSRDRAITHRFGVDRPHEIPSTPSEYEKEDPSVRHVNNTAEGRRNIMAERQRSHHHQPTTTTTTINGSPYGSGPSSRNGTAGPGPGYPDGENGKLYADFMRTQQAPTPLNQNPYAHRANEGHHYQAQRSQPGAAAASQPVGPGKVTTDSEGEEEDEDDADDVVVDGMMGQGGRGEMDGYVDSGQGGPKLRGGGGGG